MTERTVTVTIKLSFKKSLFHVSCKKGVPVCMLPYTKMLYTWTGFLEGDFIFLAQSLQLEIGITQPGKYGLNTTMHMEKLSFKLASSF